MLDPKIMCNKHLLGEHAEIHMFIGALSHGQSVKGYSEKGLLEIHNLYSRHEELVKEMKQRNYKHKSEIDREWKQTQKSGYINRQKNLQQLVNRCSECRERHTRRVRTQC